MNKECRLALNRLGELYTILEYKKIGLLDTNSHGSYLDPGGKFCAVGCLIPEDRLSVKNKWNGGGLDSLPKDIKFHLPLDELGHIQFDFDTSFGDDLNEVRSLINKYEKTVERLI